METRFSRLTSEHGGAEALRLELAPGLNVIKGPSGVLAAIPGALGSVLFGLEAGPAASAGAAGGERVSRLELEGLSAGNAWRILRIADRPAIALQAGRKIDAEQINSRMEAWIGADWRYYLRLGLAAGEAEGDPLDIEELVLPALAEMVGREALDRLREIDARLDILVRGRATGHNEPGLPDVEKAIAALEGRLTTASQEVEKHNRLQENLEQVEADIEGCDGRLQEIQGLLDAGSSWNQSRKEIDKLEKQLDFLGRIHDTLHHQVDLDRKEQELLAADSGEILQTAGEIEELQRENREAETEHARLTANLRVSRAGSGPLKRAGAPVILTGALLCVGGILGSFFNIYLVFVCFSGLPVVIYGLSRMQRFHEMSIDVGESSTTRHLRRLEVRCQQRKVRIDRLLKKLNCHDLEELAALAQLAENLGTDREIIQSRLELLPAGVTANNLDEEIERLAEQMKVARAAMNSDGPARPPLQEVESLVQEFKELKEEREKLGALRMRTRAALKELEERAPGPIALGTRRSRLVKARDDTAREIEKLRAESDRVEENLGGLVAEAVSRLEERVNRILDLLSGGVYRRVRFGEEASSLELFSELRADFILPAEAGESVSRAVWLALRLALFEAIFGRNNPPLVLRDPAEGLGEPAAGQAMQLLKEASRTRQTLVLTSLDIYDAYADRLLDVS